MGKYRVKVSVSEKTSTKWFRYQENFEAERYAYVFFPWATPELVEVGDDFIVMRTLQTTNPNDDWRPVGALVRLLVRLHQEGYAHRDVHISNIARAEDGTPRLLDWEWSGRVEASCPYDLYGPEVSGGDPGGVVRPQWWWANNTSIGHKWGDFSPYMDNGLGELRHGGSG